MREKTKWRTFTSHGRTQICRCPKCASPDIIITKGGRFDYGSAQGEYAYHFLCNRCINQWMRPGSRLAQIKDIEVDGEDLVPEIKLRAADIILELKKLLEGDKVDLENTRKLFDELQVLEREYAREATPGDAE